LCYFLIIVYFKNLKKFFFESLQALQAEKSIEKVFKYKNP